MAIHVLGSVNIDHVHRVSHFPAPGETLADAGYARGQGGKGANQALAAARAGARVRLAGAVGEDGAAALAGLAAAGVDTAGVATVSAATGHAVILVTPSGENAIVIHAGANRAIPPAVVEAALARARPGDWWLTQNETALVAESMAAARAQGLRTAHAAAPFEAAAAAAVLAHTDLLAVNEGEAAALAAHLGCTTETLPVPVALVTLGVRGARLAIQAGAAPAWPGAGGGRDAGPGATPARAGGAPGHAGALHVAQPAFAVVPVDATGAGDCFLGVLLAAADAGLAPAAAMRRAAAAAAISVTRPGAGAAMPDAAEIDAFLAARGDA